MAPRLPPGGLGGVRRSFEAHEYQEFLSFPPPHPESSWGCAPGRRSASRPAALPTGRGARPRPRRHVRRATGAARPPAAGNGAGSRRRGGTGPAGTGPRSRRRSLAPGSAARLGKAAASTRTDWQEAVPSSSSLRFPPPRGGFQLSSYLGEGRRVQTNKQTETRKQSKSPKQPHPSKKTPANDDREKKSPAAFPTSPGPATAAAAPHSWHSRAVTPRAASARPGPAASGSLARRSRSPPRDTSPLPPALPPSFAHPAGASRSSGRPGPPRRRHWRPQLLAAPPKFPAVVGPGRRKRGSLLHRPGERIAALRAPFGSRRQTSPPSGPGQPPAAGAHKAGAAAALPRRPPSR